MAGGGHAVSADGLHAASLPKQVSAAELRACLHLPAKDVAKKLGMCLTSLKKVCRLHGIVRWPHRRLKMIDRKIQSLESNMADGTQDGEALQEELAKLVHARNSLPHSYGGCGKAGGCDQDDFFTPASPMSCASTASAPSDDSVELDSDPSRNVKKIQEAMPAGHNETREEQVVEGDVNVELHLVADAAAHILVDQEEGMTQIDMMPSDEWQRRMLNPMAAARGPGNQGGKRVAKRKLRAFMTDAEMIASLAGCASPATPPTTLSKPPGAAAWECGESDEALVANESDEALVAALAAEALVAALDADALASCQCRTDDGQEVSDQELVAALAGCDKELAEHELKEADKEHEFKEADKQLDLKEASLVACSPHLKDLQHWTGGESGYGEIDDGVSNGVLEIEDAVSDGVLEMALFHGTH